MSELRTRFRAEDGLSLMEVIVVVLLVGVVMAATFSVVINTQRTNQFQETMRQVVDDGRLSVTRIRKELRSARRVLGDSGPDRLHFWVDENQDAIPQPAEQICYTIDPISATRYRIMRWDNATTGCVPGSPPAGVVPTVLAQTLLNTNPFSYDPTPSTNINDPATREVNILLKLEVEVPRSHAIDIEATVRLRNVA